MKHLQIPLCVVQDAQRASISCSSRMDRMFPVVEVSGGASNDIFPEILCERDLGSGSSMFPQLSRYSYYIRRYIHVQRFSSVIARNICCTANPTLYVCLKRLFIRQREGIQVPMCPFSSVHKEREFKVRRWK